MDEEEAIESPHQRAIAMSNVAEDKEPLISKNERIESSKVDTSSSLSGEI